jgi:hypothetical protein
MSYQFQFEASPCSTDVDPPGLHRFAVIVGGIAVTYVVVDDNEGASPEQLAAGAARKFGQRLAQVFDHELSDRTHPDHPELLTNA